MPTFVDTSALYALLDEGDTNHPRAASWLMGPARHVDEELVSHSYVVVEAAALVHRRLGTTAVRALIDSFLPTLTVVHVDERLHAAGVAEYRASLARRTSLVDHVSFEVMRAHGIIDAFAFDDDFSREGFRTVPT